LVWYQSCFLLEMALWLWEMGSIDRLTTSSEGRVACGAISEWLVP